MALRRLPWRYLLVAIIAAALGGVVGFGVARITDSRQWPDVVFTSEKWKALAQDERYVLWNDLDRRRLLIGKTRDEVMQMLGKPDSPGAERDRFSYVIKGPRGEYTLTHVYFLEVYFDQGGRSSRVAIGTD